MLKNNKIEIFYDKKDNLNVFIFHSKYVSVDCKGTKREQRHFCNEGN